MWELYPFLFLSFCTDKDIVGGICVLQTHISSWNWD